MFFLIMLPHLLMTFIILSQLHLIIHRIRGLAIYQIAKGFMTIDDDF